MLSNFNPRSPSGLRPDMVETLQAHTTFQSTQPEWAATKYFSFIDCSNNISIHAARVGCDYYSTSVFNSFHINFNPRSPSGLRQFL